MMQLLPLMFKGNKKKNFFSKKVENSKALVPQLNFETFRFDYALYEKKTKSCPNRFYWNKNKM